jgi:parvulin-like peptidyl-prolyl isomerase
LWFSAGSVFAFGSGGQDKKSDDGQTNDQTVQQHSLAITVQVPIGPALFEDIPLATVNDQPIALKELTNQLVSLHSDISADSPALEKNYQTLLDRLIATKLIILEAENIGLDETKEIKDEMESFASTTLREELQNEQLKDIQPDEKKVDTLYKQVSQEVKLTTLSFKNKGDADSFLDGLKGKTSFETLAERFVKEARAEYQGDNKIYMKLNDLLPELAKAGFSMKPGAVSQIFKASSDYLIFKLEDRRFVEDPAMREDARLKVYNQQRTDKAFEYSESLKKKYVTFDKKVLAVLDFEKNKDAASAKNGPVDFDKLLKDQRIVATIAADKPITITVAKVAKEMQPRFFHGTDKAQRVELNEKKNIVLENMLFKICTRLEAEALGIDKTKSYLRKIEEHRNSLLFGALVKKAIVPDVKISEKEVRNYYDDHSKEYLTSALLKMKSLAYETLKDAQDALDKLRRGSDFVWVSANTKGQVDKDAVDKLAFDQNLLTVTSLPSELQVNVKDVRQGDILLYTDPGKFSYVLLIEEAYPPQPQSFEQVKGQMAKIIFNGKLKEALDEYVGKLKEVYEVKVFVQ